MPSVFTGRYLKFELPNVTPLTLDEIGLLIEHRVFPPAKCHSMFGPSWNAAKVDAWVWGLKNSLKLSESVELILGYRRSDWATSDEDDEQE